MGTAKTVTVEIVASPNHLAAMRTLAADLSAAARQVALAIAGYELAIAELKVAEPIETITPPAPPSSFPFEPVSNT